MFLDKSMYIQKQSIHASVPFSPKTERRISKAQLYANMVKVKMYFSFHDQIVQNGMYIEVTRKPDLSVATNAAYSYPNRQGSFVYHAHATLCYALLPSIQPKPQEKAAFIISTKKAFIQHLSAP